MDGDECQCVTWRCDNVTSLPLKFTTDLSHIGVETSFTLPV